MKRKRGLEFFKFTATVTFVLGVRKVEVICEMFPNI